MSLATGIFGVLKYLGLVFLCGLIFYGGFFSIYVIGLVVIFWYAKSQGWDLSWWKRFLIGAGWLPVSMLLDMAITSIVIFATNCGEFKKIRDK